jgi:tetratricopeptide (TPR) repeat protein
MADQQGSGEAIGIHDFLRDSGEPEKRAQKGRGGSREEAMEHARETEEPFRLVTLVGGYRHKEIEGRHLMLELGNPAIILLLAYLLTLPGIIMEFFMLKGLWYFGFELYRTYVFLLATGCVAFGFYLMFNQPEGSKLSFKLDRPGLFIAAAGTAVLALVLLLFFGKDTAPLAIVLSIIIVGCVVLILASAPRMPKEDAFPVAAFGAGAIIVALIPVNHAFDIWSGIRGIMDFTIFDGFVVVIGVSVAFIALNSVRSQRGMFSCWLIGAMVILLIAFHELVGISASNSFEIYDQILALEGAVFSIIPLSMYFLKEFESARLWTHLLNAKKLLDRKNYERALIESERGMELLSRSGLSNKLSLPWSIYGDIYYSMGRLNRAKTCYDMALKIDPNDADTWSNLGNMLAVKGYGDQAYVAYQRATAIAPHDPQVWNNFGVVLLSLKRRDEALAAFEKAISKDTGFPMAYYNAGMVLQRSGKPVAAARLLERLVSLAPEDENFRRAHKRAEVILDYYQQAAGWRLLGADISEIIKTLLGDPGKFEDDYKEFLDAAMKELSSKAFEGDRERTNGALRRIMSMIHYGGAAVLTLRADAGLTIDQLRFAVAMLIDTNKARFKTVNNEIRLVPLKEERPGDRGDGALTVPQESASAQRRSSFI